MKKLILISILFVCFSFSNSFANLNSIYEKIDNIYEKSPENLNIINNKLKEILSKNNNKKTKESLSEIKNYIDFKLKNEEFYNQKVSEKTKELIKNIQKNSFTDQEISEKINELLKNNEFSFVDKEYINFVKTASDIAILLNHQNFKGAENLTKNYFTKKDEIDSNKINFIIKNSDYNSFGVLTQLISWVKPEKTKELIKLRINNFPKEKNSVFNQIRANGSNYSNIDCDNLKIIDENLDLLDKLHCKLRNSTLTQEDIESLDNLNNNLQNLSDKINFYTYISSIKEYKVKSIENWKELGEIIIKNDKNFINGYLGLLNYYDYKKDCDNFKKYYDLMTDNYIGDEDRKENIFNREYENCSIN